MILIIVNKIEPKIILFLFSRKIFFSIKGNKINPTNDKKGNLKNNHVGI